MKKFLLKTVLFLSLGLFVTSCFSTKQSCKLSQTQKTIKKAPVKTFNAEPFILKAK